MDDGAADSKEAVNDILHEVDTDKVIMYSFISDIYHRYLVLHSSE